jgi:glucosamine-phosphate N-acetyltransferase
MNMDNIDNKRNSQNLPTTEEMFKNLNITDYTFRFLEEADYHKSYFELLSQLTTANKPSYEDFLQRFTEMKDSKLIKIFIVEYIEKEKSKIVGTITCTVELKFIRNLGKICHIEDFVVDEAHRNKKIGSKLINLAIEYAKSIGCYKVLLDSKDEVVPFYEKMGFTRKSNGMTIYFNN